MSCFQKIKVKNLWQNQNNSKNFSIKDAGCSCEEVVSVISVVVSSGSSRSSS